MHLLDALLYKGSYGIGCLYVTLMDSSNESFGPPTHYQLACELRRNSMFDPVYMIILISQLS